LLAKGRHIYQQFFKKRGILQPNLIEPKFGPEFEGTLRMLIISRKKDEKIMIGDNIEVIILETGRNRVRFGINAPRSVSVQTRLTSAAPADGATVEALSDIKRTPVATPALKS
jgi:hypothetical protein